MEAFEAAGVVDVKGLRNVSIHQYRLKKCPDFSVVFVPIDSPLCEFHVVIPTEPKSSKGLPHILEHLVFMGSREYPQRGLLDALATQCLSDGTNAFTNDDYTAYTFSSVGWKGIEELIPVFLSHIFHPLLREEDFASEVYDERSGTGVVHCEMVGREKTPSDLMDNAMRQLLFPSSGYAHLSGGDSKLIPDVTLGDVRAFHRDYYTLSNSSILVFGMVPIESILSIIAITVKRLDLVHSDPFYQHPEPPWSKDIPDLIESSSQTVEFITSDCSMGLVGLGWRGPPIASIVDAIALECVFSYMYESDSSPLMKEFVNTDTPSASGVELHLKSFMRHGYALVFSGVDESLLQPGLIKNRVMNIIRSMCEKEFPEGDMVMSSIVSRQEHKYMEILEDEPMETYHSVLVPGLVYHLKEPVGNRANVIHVYRDLAKLSGAHWQGFMKKWMLDKPVVEVILRPWPGDDEEEEGGEEGGECGVHALSETIMEKFSEQSEDGFVGEKDKKGGKEHGDGHEQAVKGKLEPTIVSRSRSGSVSTSSISDIMKGDEMDVLARIGHKMSFLFPNGHRISLEDVNQIKQVCALVEIAGIQCQLVKLRTFFVHFRFAFSLTKLDAALRKYLVLFQELLLSTDFMDGEELIPFDHAMHMMNEDLLSCSCYLGFGESLFSSMGVSDVLTIYMCSHPTKLPKMFWWAKRLLTGPQFTSSRIRSTAAKLIANIVENRRDGASVCGSISYLLSMKYPSIHYDVSMFEQEKLCSDIVSGDDELLTNVIEKLDEIRSFLMTHVDEMFAQVSIPHRCDEYDLDFEELHHSFEEAILSMRSKDSPPSQTEEPQGIRRLDVYPHFDEMREFIHKNLLLVENVGVDSNYLDVFMPFSVKRSDEDFYPLLMACAVLSASDIGPLFRRVRGAGIGYYVSMNYSLWWGNVYFSVEETSDPVQAIQCFIETIEDYAERDTIDKILMESARSTLIFEQYSAQSIPAGIIERDFTWYAQDMTPDKAHELERRLAFVTEKDVIRVMQKMLSQMQEEKYVPFLA
eukprot:TRINITY_DN1828_c0_g1_i1.p1 TRINITY_DN1828_c0_g1~~TRINITY_DN1828_c0_g1_i1.p1  ORF type:complete len:1031 (+),score=259.00 TRINITY_DN1828_c0_g1_i1:77-3169(+)